MAEITLVNSETLSLANVGNLFQNISGQGTLNFPIPMPCSTMLYHHLVNSADDHDMAVDVGSHFHQYISSTDYISIVNKINFVIHDGKIKPNKFGDMTKLTNGLKIEAYDADNTTKILDFMPEHAIKTHDDFGHIAGVSYFLESGGGTEACYISWSLKDIGNPLCLFPGQSIRLTMQDCLGLLDDFFALVQGTIHHIGPY